MATMAELERMALVVETAPSTYPLSLADAKAHLNITVGDDDSYIEALIRVATDHAERVTQRQLLTATWNLYLDEFPDVIDVPKPPLSSVTHVKYYNTLGVLTTLTAVTDYAVDTSSEPGRIQPAYSKIWPSTQTVMNAVDIQYVAGYGVAADVPDNIIHAIRFAVAYWYEERTPIITAGSAVTLPMTFEALLGPYRVKVV